MTADELPNRILIADDNQQNRELVEAFLGDSGYEIEMAHDGQDTMDKIQSFKPDLILLDIMMPKMSGFEICQKIKQEKSLQSILILIITALRDSTDIEKAVEAGADDFLSKPIHRFELMTRVRSLLRVRHLSNERDRLLAYLEEMGNASTNE